MIIESRIDELLGVLDDFLDDVVHKDYDYGTYCGLKDVLSELEDHIIKLIVEQEPCEWCQEGENKLGWGFSLSHSYYPETETSYSVIEFEDAYKSIEYIEIKYCPNCGRRL